MSKEVKQITEDQITDLKRKGWQGIVLSPRMFDFLSDMWVLLPIWGGLGMRLVFMDWTNIRACAYESLALLVGALGATLKLCNSNHKKGK